MPAELEPGAPHFLPWQADAARQWLTGRERFAHAWLIHGTAGIGKLQFARAGAAALLCEQPVQHLACGVCQACNWLRSGNHPDFRALRPDAVAQGEGAVETDDGTAPEAARKQPSREIRIEQVRGLEAWVNTATHRGGVRVVLLYPAQALNAYSANALLKLLEEPPAHTVFLLVTDSADGLLPTLVSRCRRLPLALPQAQEAHAWLQDMGVQGAATFLAAAGGAPVAALRRFQDGQSACPDWLVRWVAVMAQGHAAGAAPALIGTLEKVPPAEWLDALQRSMVDLMLLQAGAPMRYYPGLAAPLGALAGRLSPLAVAEAARWLGMQQRVAGHPLNSRLFIHTVLLRLSSLGP